LGASPLTPRVKSSAAGARRVAAPGYTELVQFLGEGQFQGLVQPAVPGEDGIAVVALDPLDFASRAQAAGARNTGGGQGGAKSAGKNYSRSHSSGRPCAPQRLAAFALTGPRPQASGSQYGNGT
jgi:hypothetical protein